MSASLAADVSGLRLIMGSMSQSGLSDTVLTVWDATVAYAAHPHWWVVGLAALVAFHGFLRYGVMADDGGDEAGAAVMLFGAPVTLWALCIDGLPSPWDGVWSAVGLLGLLAGGWIMVATVYALLAVGWIRGTFWWRLRRGRATEDDIRLTLLREGRYWGAVDYPVLDVMREALRVGDVKDSTVGRWYASGQTPERLGAALYAGTTNEALVAHLDRTLLLDWDTVEMLAALRRPL